MDLSELDFFELGEQDLDIEFFDCGRDDINDFIKFNADSPLKSPKNGQRSKIANDNQQVMAA